MAGVDGNRVSLLFILRFAFISTSTPLFTHPVYEQFLFCLILKQWLGVCLMKGLNEVGINEINANRICDWTPVVARDARGVLGWILADVNAVTNA